MALTRLRCKLQRLGNAATNPKSKDGLKETPQNVTAQDNWAVIGGDGEY